MSIVLNLQQYFFLHLQLILQEHWRREIMKFIILYLMPLILMRAVLLYEVNLIAVQCMLRISFVFRNLDRSCIEIKE